MSERHAADKESGRRVQGQDAQLGLPAASNKTGIAENHEGSDCAAAMRRWCLAAVSKPIEDRLADAAAQANSVQSTLSAHGTCARRRSYLLRISFLEAPMTNPQSTDGTLRDLGSTR
jgi:hypothetical protein